MAKDYSLLEGFEALATVWYIEVFEEVALLEAEQVRVELKQVISNFEKKYSRFRPESLLSQLNRERAIAYDHDLVAMLALAKDASSVSGGVFDVFIQEFLQEKGYGQKTTSYSSSKGDSYYEEKDGKLFLMGSKSIDLGGIGKGYLIDKIATYLRDVWKIEQFLINGGGDIYVTHKGGEPVELFLQHPLQKDKVLGSVLVKNRAFCSSSSYVRAWKHDGIDRNHFVTKSGKEVWAASFVIGDTATTADIAATILCITSQDKEMVGSVAHRFDVEYLVCNEQQEFFGNLVVLP
jgi:FAD:protein FMN transferase